MDKYIQIFIDFIPNDKEFVEGLIPKYRSEFQLLGRYIESHATSLSCIKSESLEELLDFLDGNGFEVIRPQVYSSYKAYPIQLIPIYPEETITLTLEEPESENNNEKFQETLKKLQSTLSEYIPVQETVLSYASMEDNSGDLLEYSQLSAPRPIWICLHRCLEFLRLVSAGWSGSSTLPRPP